MEKRKSQEISIETNENLFIKIGKFSIQKLMGVVLKYKIWIKFEVEYVKPLPIESIG